MKLLMLTNIVSTTVINTVWFKRAVSFSVELGQSDLHAHLVLFFRAVVGSHSKSTHVRLLSNIVKCKQTQCHGDMSKLQSTLFGSTEKSLLFHG